MEGMRPATAGKRLTRAQRKPQFSAAQVAHINQNWNDYQQGKQNAPAVDARTYSALTSAFLSRYATHEASAQQATASGAT